MTLKIAFRPYTPLDKQSCLSIFDDNCPRFFAPNERDEYSQFLDSVPTGYETCVADGAIVGAYGLLGNNQKWRTLNWILISPGVQRSGIGSTFMHRMVSLGKLENLTGIEIAASHLSAPFFAKHGATPVGEAENGWGIGMHRVDMELRL